MKSSAVLHVCVCIVRTAHSFCSTSCDSASQLESPHIYLRRELDCRMCHLCLPVVVWGAPPSHTVTCVHVTSDQSRILTGGQDGEICLWEVSNDAQVCKAFAYFHICRLFHYYPFLLPISLLLRHFAHVCTNGRKLL